MPKVTSYVYVIAAPEVGPGRVKIGHTVNHPSIRLAQLQTGSPTQLLLIYWTEGNGATERLLHALFSMRRVHGEWFEFGDEDAVSAVSNAVQLLREAVEPFDPNRRMTLPSVEDEAQLRYEDRRDAAIATLITYGAMGQRALATKMSAPEGTTRKMLVQMESEGVVTREEPAGPQRTRRVMLNPDHPAVDALLS